jgi:hypothetical protein
MQMNLGEEAVLRSISTSDYGYVPRPTRSRKWFDTSPLLPILISK